MPKNSVQYTQNCTNVRHSGIYGKINYNYHREILMNKYSTFIQRLIERCIARITPYVHPKSIRKLFILIFSLLISMFVLMFLITSFYYSTIVRNQAYESMKTTLNMYNNNISQGFYEVSTYLSENTSKLRCFLTQYHR